MQDEAVKQKHHVFVSISYDVFNLPGFFKQFYDFVGYFQLEQSIEDSHAKRFKIWFWTDLVDIKEGESRQIDMQATSNKEGLLYFQISKF